MRRSILAVMLLLGLASCAPSDRTDGARPVSGSYLSDGGGWHG